MRTIKLTISYDGTNYNGWQLQPNGKTIQEEVERSVQNVCGGHHRVYGASRTDSGVHAKGQIAHFKTSTKIPREKLPIALNSILPQDISILKAEEVKDSFHAQFDAKRKKYRYTIYNSKKKDPFIERYALKVPYKLDVPLMRKEISALIGKHDFKAFQAKDKKERDSVRKIFSAKIKKNGSKIYFDIEGDGFLYNMVRNIIGTLIDLGRGYFPPGSMKKILKSKDRTKAGPTASAKGLALIEVSY